MRRLRMAYFQNIYRSSLSHRARAVYMYLKDHADSEGRCWPGIRTIAAELGSPVPQSSGPWRTYIVRGWSQVSRAGGRTEASAPIYTGWFEFKIERSTARGRFCPDGGPRVGSW